MAIADTSFLIDLGRGKDSAVRVAERLASEGQFIRVPAPVLFELAAGSPAGLDEKRRTLVEHFEALPFNGEHAERSGRVYKELRDKGADVGPLDAMIAGTALVEEEAVLTANVKDFSKVAGLKVLGY